MTLVELKPKNLGVWLLGLFMLLIPMQYFYSPILGMSSFRIIQAQIFEICALILFGVFLLQNIYLSLFFLWCTFLYVKLGFPEPVGATLMTIMSGLIIYEATYRIVKRENIGLLFNFIIFFAVANMIYMVFQGFGWELIYQNFSELGKYQHQLIGFMGLKAISGMFLAMAMPFFVYKYPKLSLGLFVPIYASECSCAMGAAIVSYLWQIWFLSKKVFIILATLLCIGGLAYAINDSKAGMFEDRLSLWKVALRDAVKQPIFGYGPDSFRCINQNKQFMYWKNVRTKQSFPVDVRDTIEYRHTGNYDLAKYEKFMQKGDTLDPWDNPHNEFILLFYEYGVIPFLILGFLINDMRKRFSQNKPYLIPLSGFFLGLLIMSVGQFPFHLARTVIYIMIFLACYYKISEKEPSLWKS